MKTKLNVKLIRKVQRHIMEEPRRFIMRYQIRFGSPGEQVVELTSDGQYARPQKIPDCGTVACIAGWALTIGNQAVNPGDGWYNVCRRASSLLGVEDKNVDAHSVFQLDGWPLKFRTAYDKAKTPKQRAKIACARLDHLIETGE